MIASVLVFANGMVAVFDEAGRQLPEYQGRWDERREAILRDKPAHVTVLEPPAVVRAPSMSGFCGDLLCSCHMDPTRRVHTPFPDIGFPPYCCMACARRLAVVTRAGDVVD